MIESILINLMKKNIQIALLMAASLFMEILDGTIVTTALPRMAVDFSVNSTSAALLVSTYLITVAIFIPLSGWMAQRFGKKRIWLIAVAGFTLSSLACAIAPNFGFLLGMRVLQGISGALMTPTARLIVLEKTPSNLLLKMTSYLVWPALLAPAIAPLIGGVLITYLNWHWIFLINLPIGAMIFFIGIYLIPQDVIERVTRFDWIGFLQIALSSGFLLTGAEIACRPGAGALRFGVLLLVLGLIILGMFIQHIRSVSNPLFSIKALRFPSYRISQTGGFILWLSVGAMPYLLTLYLQTVFDWSAVKAGSYIMFIFIGNIGIKPFTTPIIKTIGYKGALESAFGMVLLSAVALAFVTPQTVGIVIMALALISGVGRSLALTSYNGLSFADVAPIDRNSANTLTSVTQSMAQGLGVSLVSILVRILQLFMPAQAAYGYAFIALGLLMIHPIIETACLPKNIGANTL